MNMRNRVTDKQRIAAECCSALLRRMQKESKVTTFRLAMRIGKSQSHVEKLLSGEKVIGAIEFIDLVDAMGGDPVAATGEFQEMWDAALEAAGLKDSAF